MRIEQLIYLSVLEKCATLGQAAEELYISQSTLRSAIIALEDELEVTLIQSTRNGTKLTSFGKRVVEDSKVILDNIESWKKDAKTSDNLKETISIGISQIASYIIFHDNILNLKKEHPNLTIRLNRKSAIEIIEELKNNKCSMGIILAADEDEKYLYDYLNNWGINMKLLFEDRMMLYVNEKNVIGNLDEIDSLKVLDQYVYCGYSELEMWPNNKLEFFTKGFNEKNVVHLDAAESILSLIAMNENCYSIMLESWQTVNFVQSGIGTKALEYLNETKINHYILYINEKKLSFSEKMLFEKIQEAYASFKL